MRKPLSALITVLVVAMMDTNINAQTTTAVKVTPTGDKPVPLVDWKLTTILVLGHATDAWSTEKFLHNGSGCTEGNRLMGPHPTAAKLVVGKIIAVGSSVYFERKLNEFANHTTSKKSRRFVLILSRAIEYGSGGESGWAAIQNLRQCH